MSRRVPAWSCAVVLCAFGHASAQTIGGGRAPKIVGRVVEEGHAVAGARIRARWLAHPELPPSVARALGPPFVLETTAQSE